MTKSYWRHRFPWRSLVLFLLVGGLAAADDGCADDTSTGPNRDGIEEPAGTAVIWAKPFWAKVVWKKGGDFDPEFPLIFGEFCGKCPVGYTWLASLGFEPDFCFQCEPGFTFGRFSDGDFCWKCPPGTTPQMFGDGYTCR